MGQLGTYFDHFIKELGIYSNHFIEESGIILFIVILLVAILIVVFIWQKIRIKKAQADF